MLSSDRLSTCRRFALASLLLLVPFGAAACSSDSGDASKDTEPVAQAGNTDKDDTADEDPGSGTVDQADVPSSGVPFSEVFSRSDEFEDPDELQKALSVIGTDKPGYVSGTTIVAQPDAGEDRQFVCVSVDILDLQTYELIVVDEAGVPLDC